MAERERVFRQLLFIIDDEVVRGADAETLLDTTQTRNMLIDELLEVHTALFCLDVISCFTGLQLPTPFLCTASGIPPTKNNRNEE